MLTQDAARRFERFTEANIDNRLAIVLDNVVLSAPRIESKISDQGRITGAASPRRRPTWRSTCGRARCRRASR